MKKYLHVCGTFAPGGITSFVKSIMEQNSYYSTQHRTVLVSEKNAQTSENVEILVSRFNPFKMLRFAARASKEYERIFIHSADYLITLSFILFKGNYFLFQHGMAVSYGHLIKKLLKKIWFTIIPVLLNAKIICSSEYAFNKTRSKGVHLSSSRKL
ncbi:MAG: hypothetical protein Q7S39_05665, partial [Ignavibacteria bacterium]|nr:hypothetical protein [Ignavibacteria bacterium]